MQYAIDHRANVINLSLSGPPGTLLSKLISIALARKTSVVAAFDPSLPQGGFPASMSGVVAVADRDFAQSPCQGVRCSWKRIPTTEPGGKWYLVNGTSYAVAHISGLIALAREHGSQFPISRSSTGVVDACATLLGTSKRCDCSCRLFELAGSSNR